MCVYLFYTHNKYTHYVNKNFYFGSDELFDSTNNNLYNYTHDFIHQSEAKYINFIKSHMYLTNALGNISLISISRAARSTGLCAT